MPAPSRGARRAVALVLLTAGLGACSGSDQPSTTPKSSGSAASPEAPATAVVADLERRLAGATAPYSATVTSQTLVDDVEAILVTGKINLNAPYTGRTSMLFPADDDTPAMALDYLTTADATYTRQGEPAVGKWSRSDKYEDSPAGELNGYAELLLARGPSAVKGRETQDGVAATRLSGVVTTEEMRDLERPLHDRLVKEKVPSFDCDVWLDDTGHVVRLDQRLKIDGGITHSIVKLSKFSAPFIQKPPKV